MIDVKLLGPLEVHGPIGPIALGGRTNRAVLAMLALNRGRTVSANALLDAVWVNEPPASGVRTLHSVISRLRSALAQGGADGVIEGAGAGYRLAGATVDLDAVEHAEDVRAALRLWRGPALEEFADMPVLAAEARRLEELRLSLIERRIDADLAAANVTAAIGDLETVLAADPLREGFWERLMVALYRAGRQADALRAFQRCRDALADAGLEPSARLVRIEGQIARRDPELETATTGAAPTTTLLVGGSPTVLGSPRVSVGADPANDVVLDDPAVSGAHALLQWIGSAWVLTDLGSRNGTWVNGARLTADRALRPGDEIRMGRTSLEVRIERPRPRATVLLPEPPQLDEVQRRVLVALCRPLLDRDLLEPPRSLDELVTATGLDERTVREHLDVLAAIFGVPADDGWAALAREAVAGGAVIGR